MSLAMFQHAPAAWERTTLGDVVRRGGGSIQTGPFGSQLHAHDYVDVGIPSIMPVNIGDNRLIRDGIACISEADAQRLSKHIVRKGDIIYSRRGDVERRALVRDAEDGWFCGTGCLKVRLGQGVVAPEFASFYLGHPDVRAWIVRHAVGITMPNLNTDIMQSVPFLLPPLDDQRAIASVLGSLDDKIEQNRRTARALERLARAIFRAWFVDFEPVKAKAAGAASFPSMPQAVFDALPTTFTDSDLGPVPQGWEVRALSEVATFLNGLALQKYPPRGDGHDLPVIKIAQLRKGSTENADWASGSVPSQYVIKDGDLLFSWSGTLEVEFWLGGRGALNQHLFKVTSSRFPTWLCLLWVRQHLPWFRSIAASKATTMGHIQRGHLEAARVVVPPDGVLSAAEGVLGAIYDQFTQLQIEARSLGRMRDLLLPDLLSGRVGVDARPQC